MASHYWTRERRNESEHGFMPFLFSAPLLGKINTVCAVETVPYFREEPLIENFTYENEVVREENRTMSRMNYVFEKKKIAAPAPNDGRYQLFRQNHNGSYVSEQRADFAPKAVDMFLRAAPLFEGGEIRLWEHGTRRVVARVKWQTETTECGFSVQIRVNIFHDNALASIARHMRRAETISASI